MNRHRSAWHLECDDHPFPGFDSNGSAIPDYDPEEEYFDEDDYEDGVTYEDEVSYG